MRSPHPCFLRLPPASTWGDGCSDSLVTMATPSPRPMPTAGAGPEEDCAEPKPQNSRTWKGFHIIEEPTGSQSHFGFRHTGILLLGGFLVASSLRLTDIWQLCDLRLQFSTQLGLFGSLADGERWSSNNKLFPKESPYKHKTPRRFSDEITDYY